MAAAKPGESGFRLLRSLTFRLALIYLAIFTVSVNVLVAMLYWASVYVPLRHVERGLEREVATLLAGDPTSEEIVGRLALRTDTPAERRPFQLLEGSDGEILAGNLPQWPARPSRDGWQRFEFEIFETGGNNEFEVLARDIALPEAGGSSSAAIPKTSTSARNCSDRRSAGAPA